MVQWTIERLARKHDRAVFDCGVPALNDWLKLRAGQFDRRDLCRTFVAVRPNHAVVRGYYAISSHRVEFETLPPEEAKGMPRLDVPVVLLGKLAVDRTVQGEGLGALLLVDALRRVMQISEHVGVRAVEVEAMDDRAKSFYLRFGFRAIRDNPSHLMMPMHEIRSLRLDPFP